MTLASLLRRLRVYGAEQVCNAANIPIQDLGRYIWRCERCQLYLTNDLVYFVNAADADGAVYACCATCGKPADSVRLGYSRAQALQLGDFDDMPF